MAFDLKTATPDASIPDAGFLFGADSQSATDPSVYAVTTLLDKFLGSGGFSGSTVTADTPLLNHAQTWNNSGATFTGWKLNVTDTASASGSLLMDLQVGGTSKFSVTKGAGAIFASNLIEQRNGTNAQTFNIYNTYTDASNYERGVMKWDTNVLEIGTEKAGTGSARALELQTDGTTRLTISAAGDISTPNTSSATLTVQSSFSTTSAFQFVVWNSGQIGWSSAGSVSRTSSLDTGLKRDSAGVVKITDGSTGTGELIFIVPTSDPGITGALWNNGGVLSISA